MDVFDLRQRLVDDYARCTHSFIKIADPLILRKVDEELNAGAFWPEPLLQLNPTFQPGGTIDDLVADGTLQPECARIFRIDKTPADLSGKQLLLRAHQTAGIRKSVTPELKADSVARFIELVKAGLSRETVIVELNWLPEPKELLS